MKTATIWLTIGILTAALIASVNYLKGYFTYPPPYHAAMMLGQIVGFNAAPFAIGGFFYLFKRKLAAFFIGWLLAFLVFGGGALYQATLDSKSKPLKAENKPSVFSAPFAPWQVSFVGQPTVSQMQHGIRGEPAIQAELEYKDGSMCRAEIYRVPPEMPYSAKAAESMLRRVAGRDGLSNISLLSEDTPLGPKHSMRGGKTIEGENGPLNVVYFTQVLYTDGSFIAMTVGGLASSYPSPEVMQFLNSVKKK